MAGPRMYIHYMLSLCISAVVAQDAFPVSFTASPSSNVAPGTTLNFTCSFQLIKDNLQYVRFTHDDGKVFFEFIQEDANPPSWLQYGHNLSDDPTVNSVVWVTFPASFCNATSLEKKYGCAPTDNLYEFASASKTVMLAGPSSELSLNGGRICESGSLILESDVINKTQNISVSISNERKQVLGLTLKIDGQPVGAASPKNQERLCAYGAETHTVYKFTASGVYNLEYNYAFSGRPFTESCKVTVQERIVTITTPITSNQPKIDIDDVNSKDDVVAQDAFPVSFTASPSSDVVPGTTLKLTCSFELGREHLLDVKFTDSGNNFFEFTQGGANPPSWLQYGQKLSDDPTVNSVVWVTFPATFCNATSLEMKYGCAPSNNQYEFASADKIVTLAEKIVTMTTPITSKQPKIEVEDVNGVNGVNDEEADTTTMPVASDEGGLGGGAITGICIGVAGGLCLIVGAIWFFAFRSKDKKHKPVHQSDMPL